MPVIGFQKFYGRKAVLDILRRGCLILKTGIVRMRP
jgi:hypothetical protein